MWLPPIIVMQDHVALERSSPSESFATLSTFYWSLSSVSQYVMILQRVPGCKPHFTDLTLVGLLPSVRPLHAKYVSHISHSHTCEVLISMNLSRHAGRVCRAPESLSPLSLVIELCTFRTHAIMSIFSSRAWQDITLSIFGTFPLSNVSNFSSSVLTARPPSSYSMVMRYLLVARWAESCPGSCQRWRCMWPSSCCCGSSRRDTLSPARDGSDTCTYSRHE